MGSELTTDSLPLSEGRSTALISYSDTFRKVFPSYLALGMTYDQFWNEDCHLVKYYREAYEIKKRERNQELWLQGLYIYEALVAVAPVMVAFPKKGAKPNPYASEPYPLNEKEVREKAEREEKAKYAQYLSFMKERMQAINNKLRKEEKPSE